ncbi:MAG: histidine phosphatase family protein [Pseudomonadota bacterium]
MRLIVIRHYKTLINASQQIMGWGDAPRAQDWEPDLFYVDELLEKKKVVFDAVYTSFLERARQTGMFFARTRGIHCIHDHAELNEVNYGTLFKKSKKWVEKHIPEYKKDPDFVFPQGESFRQMQQRSVAFISSLAGKHPNKTLLVVAHAGVIRGLVSHFVGLPYVENLKRKITHRYIGDFQFEGPSCVRYDELGKPSGFVNSGPVAVPCPCGPAREDPGNNAKGRAVPRIPEASAAKSHHPY